MHLSGSIIHDEFLMSKILTLMLYIPYLQDGILLAQQRHIVKRSMKHHNSNLFQFFSPSIQLRMQATASSSQSYSALMSLTAVLMKFRTHPERDCSHSPPNVLDTHETEAEC